MEGVWKRQIAWVGSHSGECATDWVSQSQGPAQEKQALLAAKRSAETGGIAGEA